MTAGFENKRSTMSGVGDVVGPASSTDNAIARFDGATGKIIQNSAVTIADTTGDITGGKYNTVAISGTSTPTLAVTGTTTVSGANTGDQTSIVGITGTKEQFKTACTDGDFIYSGDSATLATITTTGAIELGHASDTTLSRASAGVLAVEGIPAIIAGSTTVGQVPTITGANTYSWQTPSAGGSKQIRITIPGELITDASIQQGLFFYNDTGSTITISNVAFTVSKAAAGTGAASAFNVYKSSGTASNGIDTNAVNLFTSAVNLTTNYTSITNTPNTTTVESGRYVSVRVTSSAGATNKASNAQIIITYT